jgi:hypothetical protein
MDREAGNGMPFALGVDMLQKIFLEISMSRLNLLCYLNY